MRSRGLTKSNENFQKAVCRWPVGLASAFRYCGDDQMVYVKDGKGGPRFDIDSNSYVQSIFKNTPENFVYADRRFGSSASLALIPVWGFDAASL